MTHYDTETIATLGMDELTRRLEVGDTIDYVDDGEGAGGYVEGCGDDRAWDDLRRAYELEDTGSGYTVVREH